MKQQSNISSDTHWTDEQLTAFISQIESEPLLSAPSNLKDEILLKSMDASIRIPLAFQKQKKELSGNMQFLFYSLKISAAVLLCLFQLTALNKLPDNIGAPLSSTYTSYQYAQLEKEAEHDAQAWSAEDEHKDLSVKAKEAGISIYQSIQSITTGGKKHD